ncbi:Lpar1 [Phodopus roborovskii]|uniref:Lysophosphatidic acid receptor 1 n=1 Tax=Phodopus roborovskii TaxID=109678 RepID=A0AAU9ZEF6_PHORO|nr:Lpar1 [Phodopus roborovskii]
MVALTRESLMHSMTFENFTAMNEPQCFYNESIAFFYNRSGKYLATEWNTVSKLVMGLGITVCVFIMLANLLVMVAIYVNRRFHFPIYYLMANLAAADFFAGLAYFYLMFNTGPNTRRLTVSTWLLRQGLIDTSLTASVANLLAIAIERHITVFRMQLHTRMSNRRVVVVIVVIWTMAIVMGAIPSVGWNCICDIDHCSNMAPLYSDSYLVFWAIFNLVTFVVMVVLYAHIFGYVRQRTMRMSRHSSGPRRNRDTMMSLLKTVVITVFSFFPLLFKIENIFSHIVQSGHVLPSSVSSQILSTSSSTQIYTFFFFFSFCH